MLFRSRAPNPADAHVEDLTKKKKTPKNIMDYMFDETAIQYEFYKSGKVRFLANLNRALKRKVLTY